MTGSDRFARTGLLGAALLAGTLALSACSTPPPPTFDLTAASDLPGGTRAGRGAQLVVPDFTAVEALNSNQILVRRGGQISYLAGAQWAERLPHLVQVRLIQSFENDHRLAAVGRPEDRITPDATLIGEIRDFGLQAENGQAVVTLAVKIVNPGTGRIVAAQVFTASVAAGASAGPRVATALDGALQTVLRDIVVWTNQRI